MANKKRKCIVCGKEYDYCNNCRQYKHLPAWMALYHDENCRNIMNIATEYMAGNMTKETAKLELDACDLSGKKSFKESVLKAVNEIQATKKAFKNEAAKETDDKTDAIKDI